MTLMDVLDWLVTRAPEFWLVPPVIILAGIVAIGFRLRKKLEKQWLAIAEHTGLRLKTSIVRQPQVVGDYGGRRLIMTPSGCPQGRAGAFRKRWTRVAIDVRNPEFIGLRILRQDIVDTLLTIVGYPDVRIGDATFDRRYLIHTRDTELTKQLLREAALRDALVRANVDTVEMFGTTLAVYYARQERDAVHAELLFTAAIHMANGIDALGSAADSPAH